MSGLASGTIAAVNAVLLIIMRRFSMGEHHETSTKMNVSVAVKLTTARFLNSSIVLVAVNWKDSTKWFDQGNLVYDASLLMMILVFGNPIMQIMDPKGLVKKI